MSGWRAMESLLVLRDQCNVIAPNRDKGADGLVGDTTHQGSSSDHNPHNVPGVGSAMVTALDLTHDPPHGFDSYKFAETLRKHRDNRIKYVISNGRIFSSYANGDRAAWAWGSYSGTDPHVNHCHVSVLDKPVSDTNTPWNLEGFDMSEAEVITGTTSLWDQAANRSTPTGRSFADDAYTVTRMALEAQFKAVTDRLVELDTKIDTELVKLDEILAKLDEPNPGPVITFPRVVTIEPSTVTWS
jgi:hypothetical protein